MCRVAETSDGRFVGTIQVVDEDVEAWVTTDVRGIVQATSTFSSNGRSF